MPGDVSLKGIEFVIKGSTTNATSSIDTLIGRLNALQKALGNTSGLKKMTTSMNGLKKAVDDFAKADMKGTVSSLKELGKVSKSLEGLANMSKDLAAFARGMSKLAEHPEDLADVAVWLARIAEIDFSNLVEAGNAIKNITGAIQALTNGASGGGAEKQVSVFQRIGDALKNFGTSAAKGFGNLLTFPLKNAWENASGLVKSLGGVVSGFKRILGYRMIRSIIREITQGISEGIKNLYGWSKLMGGAVSASGETFSQSLDRITTSLAYFKNSVGAAVAPIIGALAPAIDFLIDKIVTLLNLINQLIARLAGATSWNKAIKKAQEFGAAAGGAGKAAKEALAYLAPFDELNRLPADNGSGGGGGGGGADYSGLFEEVMEFNEEIADFADKVRDAINRADWQGLGILIGNKINEIIDRIDFATLGTKVGEKINALFTTEYWTLKTINFQNIGKKIAEFLTGENGIGGALRAIDFTSIGGILAEKITMLPDILIGAINNLDFSVVGKSIGDFVRGFFDDMKEFVDNTDWGELFENIVTGIVEFFKGLDIGSVSESILGFLGSVVGAVVEGIDTLLIDVAEAITDPNTWALVVAWLQDLPAHFKNAAIKIANAFVSPIVEKWNSIVEQFNESGLSKLLGYNLKPINFEMIPEIPDSELNRNYNEAKAKIEAQSRQDPVNIIAEAIITKIQDKIKNKDRDIKDMTADVGEVDISGAPLEEIPSIGHITTTDIVNTLKSKIPSVGTVTETSVSAGVEAEVPSKADINSSTTRNLNVTPLVTSTANLMDSTISSFLTTPILAATGAISATVNALATQPKIDSTGNITKSQVGDGVKATIGSLGVITETANNAKLKTPQIPSTGDIVGTKNNNNLPKAIVDSTGKLVDSYVDNYKINKPDIASSGAIDYASVNAGINKPNINANGKVITASISDNVNKPTLDVNGEVGTITNVPQHLWIPYTYYEDPEGYGDTTIDYGDYSPEPGSDVHNDPTKPTGHVDRLASGGALYGGRWHDIPMAALGGRFHGSLFWAGEAGAELVGHAGNRTEVLNKSQLASTMYAAVSNALHGMSIKVASPSASAFGSDDGVDEETMYRAFRRALDETDFGGDVELDGETLYRAMVRRNNSNTRMTGVNAMAMA